MAERVYLDTSIWRDYFEDRKDNLRPLGEFPFQFLKECKNRKIYVIYSGLVISELRREFSESKIQEMFSFFEDILIRVDESSEQLSESRSLAAKIKEYI